MEIKYKRDESSELWWCNIHQRRAEYILERSRCKIRHVCNPNLGGIMLPCDVVNLTDIMEIE